MNSRRRVNSDVMHSHSQKGQSTLNRHIKLSDVLPELEKEIERAGRRIRPITKHSRRSEKRAYAILLLGNYSEVVLILRRLLDNLNEIADLQARIKYDEVPEAERPENERLAMRTFDLVALLRLDMKALYVWTAFITDVLRDTGRPIRLDELNRISLFRHKLITHVHETPFFKSSHTTKSGTKYNPKQELIEDQYLPFDFRDRRFAGLKTLVRQASSFIPELLDENNRFEQIKILYRRINSISNADLKRRVKKFVFRVGLPTDSPGVIASALLDGLNEYRLSY
jgi:hypothetical protein